MVDINSVRKAREVILGHVKNTPCLRSRYLSKLLGCEIFCKHENMQKTGSFKIRGALNKISSLDKKTKGVVTSSAGNHGQGVALASHIIGFPAHIVVPTIATEVKMQACQSYGANVILEGKIYDDAYAHAMKLSEEQDLTFVHAYEDDLVVAGQGTIALEIDEILSLKNEVDCIVVPIGGGGLISGIAVAVKHFNPNCRVVGVQTTMAPSMKEFFHTKKMPTKKMVSSPLGDGVSVKVPSKKMYEKYLSKFVDDIVEVDEKEISDAFITFIQRIKNIVEPAGCLSLASVLSKKVKLGKNNVLILSGGNIDLSAIKMMIDMYE